MYHHETAIKALQAHDMGNGALYNALTALIGHMTMHALDYRTITGAPDITLEKKITALFTAKEIVRDHIDPCDIPF